MFPAVIEVTQRTSMMAGEATTLTLPVPEDGNVHIKFKLQDDAMMLFVRVGIQTYSSYIQNIVPSGKTVLLHVRGLVLVY